MTVQALVFDVFGTCVDWRTGVAEEAARWFSSREISTDPFVFADYWRSRYQPAMQRIRSGNRGYVALDELHHENLLESLAHFDVAGAFTDDDCVQFARAWEKLPAWPDVSSGLQQLKHKALIAPCSNGSIALMAHLARYAQLPWDAILGADIAQNYKPERVVYLACASSFRLAPEQVMMVAAHNSDLHAARDAGLQTAFIARPEEQGKEQSTDLAADSDWTYVVDSFHELCDKLG